MSISRVTSLFRGVNIFVLFTYQLELKDVFVFILFFLTFYRESDDIFTQYYFSFERSLDIYEVSYSSTQ